MTRAQKKNRRQKGGGAEMSLYALDDLDGFLRVVILEVLFGLFAERAIRLGEDDDLVGCYLSLIHPR